MKREGTLLITREVRWRWVMWRTMALLALPLAAACTQKGTSPSQPDVELDQAKAECLDRDGDGFGEHCPAGPDCNDHDHSVHEHCLHCAEPEEGCACDEAGDPARCYLDKTTDDAGAIMCHEGTRYCRDSLWSACEEVHDYPLPDHSGATTAIVGGAPTHCSDCDVNCFAISDQIIAIDGGVSGSNVEFVPGGGLTLGVKPDTDAGPPPPPPPPPPPCTVGVGVDYDCDGIPNEYDPYPYDPPFATANPSIFLHIPPSQTGTGSIALIFKVTSADVYFLVDQSGSMDQERDKLTASLTTGDYINNAAYQCSDFDFDFVPNNEQKDLGIIGAIRCLIRDANFGVGLFREIPFSPTYAPNDHLAFANYHDISDDIPSVLAAVNRLATVGNIDWPEDSMLALHQTLTGGGMYFGVGKRAIPRATCPPLTWGYPCFRQGAVPIVIMFTDAQFHNGPDSGGGGTFNYSSSLPIVAGKDSTVYPVTSNNDTFATAFDLGDITDTYKTFTGDSSLLTSDLAQTYSSCLPAGTGYDAWFKFNLTSTKNIKIESTASQYDTILSLYTGQPGPLATSVSSNTNELGASANSLGQLFNNGFQQTGSTSTMVADYQWTEAGCTAATLGKDAVFKFDLSTPTSVQIDTIGSSFDTVLGLFNAAPLAPSFTTIPTPNSNEEYTTALPMGDVYNRFFAYNATTVGQVANYSAAQMGCSSATGADAAYTFSVSTRTKMRFSTEGSGTYDTVMSLYKGVLGGTTTVPITANTNEDYATAFNIGTLDGKILKLTGGNTAAMAANYFANQVGCNAVAATPDAVFKFHLNSPRTVRLDTIGTTWDTALALYNQAPDSTTHVTSANTESFVNAQNLGTLNAQDIFLSGGSTLTSVADFTTAADPCSTASTATDVAYRFKLTSSTNVKLDLTNSTFDATIALQPIPPVEVSTPVTISNDTSSTPEVVGDITGTSVKRTGDTGGLVHNYNFTPSTAARDGVFKFTLASAKTIQVDTVDSEFDTAIALYNTSVIPNIPTAATATTSGLTTVNDLKTAPVLVGGIDDSWKVFNGSTTTATADWNDTSHSCANASSPDVYFKFTLANARTVNIGLSTSSFANAKLMVYSGTTLATSGYVSTPNCLAASAAGTNFALAAGTYWVVVKGSASSAKGNYYLTIKDVTAPLAMSDDVVAGSDTTSLLTYAAAAGTYYVVLGGPNVSAYGRYTIRFRDKTYWDSFSNLTCNNGTGNNAAITYNSLPAGDYGIIVKGKAAGNAGTYTLRVTDTVTPPSPPGVLQCDDDSGGGITSLIDSTTALPAGDYWIILKGAATGASGAYTLTLTDVSVTVGNLQQCDDDGGESPSSLIERDLDPGFYQLLVKGKSTTGAYKLTVRDVTNFPINRLGCDNDSGGSSTSKLVTNLDAGSYYVTVKGKTSTAAGSYKLNIRDLTNHPAVVTACNNNESSGIETSKITTTTPLTPGTYYVNLKGASATELGPYQLSLGGDATFASNYVPPTWTETLKAIKDTGAHVITILSCKDDPVYGDVSGNCKQARNQAYTLATESKALGTSNNKLVFDISRDGTGLSNTVVNAVSQLANYLVMNVTVRVTFEPDANPGFIVTPKAIDVLGDGCSGLIGIEHQNCVPGASPHFLIDFKNPADHPVPLNPHDPKGGYNFRAELIGNKTFIVDAIPIYIIPEAVPPTPAPPPNYYASGTYEQNVAASTCNQTQSPDWSDLTWEAEVYKNTSVTFSMCTSSDEAGLVNCPMHQHQIAKITGTTTCTRTADCAKGFCDTTIGVCQVVTGGSCMQNLECPSNAYCDTTTSLCTYNTQPTYIARVLGADNLKPYSRMTVGLAATEPITKPPVVHSWSANYHCKGTF